MMNLQDVSFQLYVTNILYWCFCSADSKFASGGRFEKPLRISTVVVEPYVMPRSINDTNYQHMPYEGFIIDILDQISMMLDFQYEISQSADGNYGHRQASGKWNGVIGEVINKEADIGAAPLYITDHRSKVVDFSVPFLKVQATVLLRKPPIGQDLRIKTVGDLLTQTEIKYGTLNTGLLLWSFRNTNNTILKQMFRKMQRFKPSPFTETNEEGITRVRKEKFAFILPSTIGEYISQKEPCDLVTVDRFLMERGFGLITEKESPLMSLINNALLKLRDNGFINRAYNKWWVRKSACGGIQSSSIFSTNSQPSSTISQPSAILPLVASVFASIGYLIRYWL